MSADANTVFEQDFHAWTQQQAAALRRAAADRVNVPIDWENVAEEIECMGRSERNEIEQRLTVLLTHLLTHLLTWLFCPDLRERCLRPWRLTIRAQRRMIVKRLSDSPSLRPFAVTAFAEAYRNARGDAADEVEADIRSFPPDPPFSLDEALDPAYPPDLFPPEWRG